MARSQGFAGGYPQSLLSPSIRLQLSAIKKIRKCDRAPVGCLKQESLAAAKACAKAWKMLHYQPAEPATEMIPLNLDGGESC